MRALAVVAASLLLCITTARADSIDTGIRQLGDARPKVRLAAALALAKSHDPRAVIALADSLGRDGDATVRRVAALALGKMIDAHTAPDARELGLSALADAVGRDRDDKVRYTAERAQQDLGGLVHKHAVAPGTAAAITAVAARPGGGVFINVDPTTDQSRIAPSGAGERLSRIVKRRVEHTGYTTSWPGGLPTQTDLTSAHARGFIVASTVKKIELNKAGHQTQVSCKLEIRVAPWSGSDGGEKWEANRAASASGSAKALTGNTDREIAGGVRDCLEAVAEDVTDRQILPFLKRLTTAGS
ncbi:MAG TPA: HEAT repeat domain-containing protein [Kofleriaceae bacterium]